MKRLSFYSATATLLLMMSSAASAAHISNAQFDFVKLANISEYGASSITINSEWGGRSVTATAMSGGTPAYAYLDGQNILNNPAGLGVCKQLTAGNQCAQSSHDDINPTDVLKLSFDAAYTIKDIELHNAFHLENPWDGSIDISVDGGTFISYTLGHVLHLGLTGTNFLFANNNIDGGTPLNPGRHFYLAAINTTPIPAAAWLFVSGLGSLGLFRKRKNKLDAIAT